jgi:hypothetical protein
MGGAAHGRVTPNTTRGARALLKTTEPAESRMRRSLCAVSLPSLPEVSLLYRWLSCLPQMPPRHS